MKIEKRTVAVTELRISRDKPAKIIGKIPYNSLSEDLGFFEILKKILRIVFLPLLTHKQLPVF